MNDQLRPINYNGHTPIGETDDTLAVCPACRREAKLAGKSPDYVMGYQAALLDVMGAQIDKAAEILDGHLAKLRRPAA